MSGIDDLICALLSAFADGQHLLIQIHSFSHSHRKTNFNILFESLQNSSRLIKTQYEAYLSLLGPRFAFGDETGRESVRKVLIRMQTQILYFQDSNLNGNALAKFWSEAWDLSESTRLRTITALKEQFERLTLCAPGSEERSLHAIKDGMDLRSEPPPRYTPPLPLHLPLSIVPSILSAFRTLDTLGLGYISGSAARTFTLSSQISERTLQRVWTLAELDPLLRVTKCNFCLAMVLLEFAREWGEDVFMALARGNEGRVWIVEVAEAVGRDIESTERDEERKEELGLIDQNITKLDEKEQVWLEEDLVEEKVRTEDAVDWFGKHVKGGTSPLEPDVLPCNFDCPSRHEWNGRCGGNIWGGKGALIDF